MIILILFLFIVPLVGCSQGQQVLPQDYSFLGADGEVTKLHQSHDTLYVLKCYIDGRCQPQPSERYKILSSNKTEEFVILKLQKLHTVELPTDTHTAPRYERWALKIANDKELGWLPLALGLSKQQLDTTETDIRLLKKKFFFTFFGDNYLKEFSSLKKLTSKVEANEIIEFVNSGRFKTLIESYSNTDTQDVYAAGLSAELLNRACLEKGYSPIGAGRAINVLMRQ